jgi:outer membrane lipoprotein SlyB
MNLFRLVAMTMAFCSLAFSADCGNDRIGAVVGGALGGALGNQVGQGSGKTAATIGGAIIGSMMGGSNRYSDCQPQQSQSNQFREVYQPQPQRYQMVQECYDETVQVGTTQCGNGTDTIGAIVGGAIGGALGNQAGRGSGKTAATIGGAIIGSMMGGANGSSNCSEPIYETVRKCITKQVPVN